MTPCPQDAAGSAGAQRARRHPVDSADKIPLSALLRRARGDFFSPRQRAIITHALSHQAQWQQRHNGHLCKLELDRSLRQGHQVKWAVCIQRRWSSGEAGTVFAALADMSRELVLATLRGSLPEVEA